MFKKISILFLAICILLIIPTTKVYAATHPLLCDVCIYTTDFISCYKDGTWVETSYENNKDINDLPELEMTYNDGEYTLNIINDITLTAKSDFEICFLNIKYNATLNIIGDGTLTIIAATDDFTNTVPECIDVEDSTLNIGLSNNDTNPKINIIDNSSSSKNIKSTAIIARKSDLSIYNANLSIKTSKEGIELRDSTDNPHIFNISNSSVALVCKDNDLYNKYYGILCDFSNGLDGSYSFNFKDSTFSFVNEGEQDVYCINTDKNMTLDGCIFIANEGSISNLFDVGYSSVDTSYCTKVIDSKIYGNCLDECFINRGKGDMFFIDSNVNITSSNASAILTNNNVNITISEARAADTVDNDIDLSIKTTKSDTNSIVYEITPKSRDNANIHHLIMTIAPTLNIFDNESLKSETSITLDLINDFDFSNLKIEKVSAIISFDSNGGTPNYNPIIIKNYNEINIDDYKPTRQGYIFEGWYFLNPDNTISIHAPLTEFIESNTTAKNDTTVRAVWKEIKKPSGDKHIVLDTGVN